MATKGVKKIDYDKRERNYAKKNIKKFNHSLLKTFTDYAMGRYTNELQEILRKENLERTRIERKKKIAILLDGKA